VPQLGFWVVDVRDLADLHVRTMASREVAGQRFIAAGDFMWMSDIANTLRTQLGSRGARVPNRRLPDFVVRLRAVLAAAQGLARLIGRRFPLTSEKSAARAWLRTAFSSDDDSRMRRGPHRRHGPNLPVQHSPAICY
jgi:dihydroflavonol-4-reductase